VQGAISDGRPYRDHYFSGERQSVPLIRAGGSDRSLLAVQFGQFGRK